MGGVIRVPAKNGKGLAGYGGGGVNVRKKFLTKWSLVGSGRVGFLNARVTNM